MSMRPQINFSAEAEMLLDVAAKFAANKSSLPQVRATMRGKGGFDKALWQEMAQLGWTALTLDEADGGSQLGLGEAAAILEPLGRNLCAQPLAGNILAASLAKALGQKAVLARLAGGEQASLAWNEPAGHWTLGGCEAQVAEGKLSGTKTLIQHADSADFLLVLARSEGGGGLAGPLAVFLLERAQFADKLVAEKVIDETQSSFRLDLSRIEAQPLGEISLAVQADIERQAQVLLAAEMCGAIAGVLDIVVDYLKTRKQFGKFIGAYQSLKHPTVDVLLGLEAARSHLYYAAGLPVGEEAMLAAHMAKAVASDTLTFASDRAIQFLGANGFTYDCDAQLFLRRALWSEYQWGDSAYHRQKIAAQTLGTQ